MARLSARLTLALLLTAASACSGLPTSPDASASYDTRLSKAATNTAATQTGSSGGATTQGGYINPHI
jgi:hypothetical protein